jgi:hypothetical protein
MATFEMPGVEREVIISEERPEHKAMVAQEETTLTELARVTLERKALEKREEELKIFLTQKFIAVGLQGSIKLRDIGRFTLTAGRSKKTYTSPVIIELEQSLAGAKESAREGIDFTLEPGTPSIIFTSSK